MSEHIVPKIVSYEPRTDEEIQQPILSGCIAIAADAFGVSSITPDFELDVYNHLKGHHLLLAHAENGEPVGFASVQYVQVGSGINLYVSGLVIKHHAQKNGVGTALVVDSIQAARKSGLTVEYVSGRTQNPVVAQARMHYCDPVYPISAQPTEEVLAVADSLHTHLGMLSPMDRNTLVTRDVFPVPLNRDSRPVSKLPNVNAFFDTHVGPRDAVFIIGRPTV